MIYNTDPEVMVEFIRQFGGVAIAIITAIVSIVTVVMTNKSGAKKLESSMENNRQKIIQELNASQVPLIEHTAIPNIEEHIRQAKSLYIPDVNPNRVKMASYYLLGKNESWLKAAKEFAEEVDRCGRGCETTVFGCNQIYTYAMDMYNNGMEYEINCLKDLYGEDEESMTIFNDRLKLWHEDRKDRFKKKIYDVCMIHDTYRTCYQKGSRILEALDEALDDTLKDVKITVLRINGQLDTHSWRNEPLSNKEWKKDDEIPIDALKSV